MRSNTAKHTKWCICKVKIHSYVPMRMAYIASFSTTMISFSVGDIKILFLIRNDVDAIRERKKSTQIETQSNCPENIGISIE